MREGDVFPRTLIVLVVMMGSLFAAIWHAKEQLEEGVKQNGSTKSFSEGKGIPYKGIVQDVTHVTDL